MEASNGERVVRVLGVKQRHERTGIEDDPPKGAVIR
jgi:hypothetical protein